VAALGFTFYNRHHVSRQLSERGDRCGTWINGTETVPSGYRVMVGRTDGRRLTSYEPLVDGFLPQAGSNATTGRGAGATAWGRPVDVVQLPDGSILISNDTGNRILRV
jgi:glucose/arabinose dehydrogenase